MTKKKINVVLITFLITFSLIVNLNRPETNYLDNINSTSLLLSTMAFIGIYTLVSKRYGKGKNKILLFIFSILISLLNVICYYFHYYNSLNNLFTPSYQIIKSLIVFGGYSFIIYYILSIFFEFIEKEKYKTSKNKYINFLFEKHPFWGSVIILSIFIIPLLFITYPGNMSPDGFDELRQYYHANTWSVDYINLIDESNYINGHHSPLHTYIIGKINDLGIAISSPNIGLFLNAIVQSILTIIILAYTIKSLKDLKVSIRIRILVLVFYLLSGFVILPTTAIYKDIPFSLMILAYTISLIKIIYLNQKNTGYLIETAFISLIMCLLTKKGIYAVILTTIILFILIRKEYKVKISFVVPIAIFFAIESLLYPRLGITPGSSREMLAIPIQQISRVVKYKGDELSNKEKDIINNLIEVDQLKDNYNPKNADNIKNYYFNKNYKSEEMKEFLQLYIQKFFKYPHIYVSGFINTVSDYFYTDNIINPGGYKTDEFRMNIPEIKYQKSEWRVQFLEKIDKLYNVINKIPIINLLYSMPTYNWAVICMTIYIFFKKEKKYIIPLIPSLVIILFLLVSPMNGNKRYMFPLFYTLPLLIAYFSVLKGNILRKAVKK